jgi:hypothetical protein
MQVGELFAAATWCGRPIRVLTPAGANAITAMKDKILALAPSLDFTKAIRAADLSAHPTLQKYMEKHTRPTKYTLQWMRDPPQLPPLPLANTGTGTPIAENNGTLHSRVNRDSSCGPSASLYHIGSGAGQVHIDGMKHTIASCFGHACMRCMTQEASFRVHRLHVNTSTMLTCLFHAQHRF